MNQSIRVLPTAEMAPALADLFVAAARQAIVDCGRFAVALAGGHTPAAAYKLLAQEPRRDQIDWSKVHVFWGDERNVPSTDPNSNEGMARDSFLDSVPIPAGQIHPMYIGSTNQEAAENYSNLLHTFFDLNPNPSPVTRHPSQTFDLVMLGMGPDGHTLSLFPGAGNLAVENWVIPAETDVFAVHDRITLTPAVVSLAWQVVFAVEGQDKAEKIKEVLVDKADLPSGVVARGSREVIWLLDEAAASQLSSRP